MADSFENINTPGNPLDKEARFEGSSFRKLYERAQPGLIFTAYRLLRNQQEAEDVVTDAFLKFWNQRDRFANEDAAAGWLKVTTRNACLDLLKHKKIHVSKVGEITTEMYEQTEETFDEELLGQLLKDILRNIDELPRKSRQVFQLRYIQGLSNEEIAKRLGIRYQSVRNHLSTALKTLRLKLGDKTHLIPLILFLLREKN